MMFVQNGNRPNPDLQAVGRGGNEAPKVPAAVPAVESGRSAAVEPPKAAAQQPSSERLKTMVENLNKVMRQSQRNLEFRVDEGANRVVVTLKDSVTGEVIRQIPSDEMLAISRQIGEFQQGLLLKQKA